MVVQLVSHLWPFNELHFKERLRKGLCTDRDRWICIRQSFAPELTPGFLGNEYDRLLADPRVERLEITEDDGIKLYTQRIIKKFIDSDQSVHRVFLSKSAVRLEFSKYSFRYGAFAFDSPTLFVVQCLETGHHLETEMPKYFFSTDIRANGFCFGDRTEYLNDLANKGEFFQLYLAVLECLWHVNAIDVPFIIANFRKILPDGTIEPYQKRKEDVYDEDGH